MPFRLMVSKRAAAAIALGAMFVPIAAAGPAAAQMFGLAIHAHPRPLPPRGVYAIAPHHALLPPGMALAILDDQGFRPAGRVVLRGDALVVAALDPRGRPVTVVMDAYDGEILNVQPRNLTAPAPPPRVLTAPKLAPNPGARVLAVQPPARPKQLAGVASPAPAAASPITAPARSGPAYPPPEAGVLKKLTRPAQ